MQSHWNKLLTIRVVDAGYLLAGMEPERKWQFAPPLVKNLFNLIREKTGAVTMNTLPEGRSEITQAEFQALKAEYGITPATEPKAAPKAENSEQPEYQTPEYQAAYAKAWVDLEAVEKLEIELKNWQAIPAATVSELERKEQKIAALKAERAALLAGVFPGESMQQPIEPQATTPSPAPAPFLERVAQRGYVLALPNGQTHVQFGELAHLIADALWPEAGADDTRMSYGLSRASLDGELVQAVKAGTLQVKDPLTFGPHTFPVGNALLSALVTVDDLREFVAGRGLKVETVQTHTTPSPAPVVTETVEQRRARYLALFETEEKREKRGALQRVADSEEVDRSNMSKDIDKARAARDAQKRAGGGWASQLVQDGKRTG